MRPTLDWLLAPLSPAIFREHYLDRGVLHVERGEPGYHAELFSRRELTELLWRAREAAAELAYAHAAGRTRYVPQRHARAPLPWLREQYREGATVVVNSVSSSCLPVAQLCRAVGDWLGAPVHANAYLAPPHAAGYGPHFDTDDTVFLQIEGSKRWQLFEPRIELPLLSQLEGVDPGSLGPGQVIKLGPGDLLYLPRGTIHTPVAGPQGSLHLTLGLHHQLWRDVLVDLLAEAGERHALLQQPARVDDAPALAGVLELLAEESRRSGAFDRAAQRLLARETRVTLPDDWS